jgi:glycosyltransferase involved in cell wall biosynthesis
VRKIKILQIIADSSLSGAPVTILNFARQLDKNKFEMTVVCPRGPFSSIIKEVIGVQVINVQMRSKWDVKAIRQIHDLINSISPDIVDCHGVRAGLLVRLASINLKKPAAKIIYTEHLWTKEYKLKNPISHWLQIMMLKYLDVLTYRTIAVSKAVGNFLIENKITRPEKLVVLYSGLQIPKYSPKEKLNSSTKTIGFVGSLTERKGLQYLLQAIPKVISHFPAHKIKLIIIGDGPEKAILNSLAHQLKIEGDIYFTGSIKNVSDFYPTFDLYIQPSLDEAFGFAVLEAMSYGLPVITSNVGGLPEILNIKNENNIFEKNGSVITDCGILVNSGDSSALSTMIIKCLKDDDLTRKLSLAARLRAEEFSAGEMVQTKEKFYSEIVNNS